MKHITFSGIDKSGKTTLEKAFMEATGYQHYVVDRDPTNYYALNAIQDRGGLYSDEIINDYSTFINKFKQCLDLAILLVCSDEKELDKRFEESNEPDLVGDFSKKDHQLIIGSCFSSAGYKNTLIIDTCKYSVKESVNMIIEKLGEIDANK